MQDKLSRDISKMLNKNPAVIRMTTRKKNANKALGDEMAYKPKRLRVQRGTDGIVLRKHKHPPARHLARC
jgi:hypothetical protein